MNRDGTPSLPGLLRNNMGEVSIYMAEQCCRAATGDMYLGVWSDNSRIRLLCLPPDQPFIARNLRSM